jgi:hypothetical protein
MAALSDCAVQCCATARSQSDEIVFSALFLCIS